MTHIHLIHINYLFLACYLIVNTIIIFRKWDFISRALSEGDSPSSKRLGAFFLVQIVCMCELFYTLKTGVFEFNHLVAILVTIVLCWGIATVPQILQALGKGSGDTTTVTKTATTSIEIKEPTT